MKDKNIIEAYEKKIYDQQQLLKVAKALGGSLELFNLIENILNICLAQAQTFQAGIFLQYEIDDNNFYLYDRSIGFGIKEPHTENKKILYNDPLILFFKQNHLPIEVDELEKISKKENNIFQDIIQQLKELNICLVLPMYMHNEMNALLVLGEHIYKTEYTEDEKKFLLDLSSIVAVAISNARLYEKATRDIMTKIYNRNFFQNTLREFIEEKKINPDFNFSLCFIDIDFFKVFNDTYGHAFGDLVLKLLAKELLRLSHQKDIVCRYGGEEFLLLLHNIQLKEAIEYAEQIRIAAQDILIPKGVPHSVDTPALHITISIGVGEFNLQYDTFESFLERCDQALYKAKENGRNQVQISEPKILKKKDIK